MTVRMWPRLPKDDPANGLNAIETELNENPEQTHVIIAIINRRRATFDDDADELIPTARICAIEVLRGTAADNARELLLAARKNRTGNGELPFSEAAATDPADDEPGPWPGDPGDPGDDDGDQAEADEDPDL